MGKRERVSSGSRGSSPNRGQVSLEYMLVMGFTFLILVPLLLLYVTTQQQTQSSLAEGQILRLENTVRDIAERVYYAGEPAQEVLAVTVPDRVVAARIDNTTIIYTMHGPHGNYDVATTGLVPLNGTLPIRAGQHRLTILAANNTVYVSTS